jgi:hypothetical protein
MMNDRVTWIRLLITPAQGDVGRFNEDKDLVAGFELHLFDRAGGDNRGDLADARLDNDFTHYFVGDDALDCAGQLIADALFHNAGLKDDLQTKEHFVELIVAELQRSYVSA